MVILFVSVPMLELYNVQNKESVYSSLEKCSRVITGKRCEDESNGINAVKGAL